MKTNLISTTASSTDRQDTSAHPWFEWAVAFFSTCFVVGLYLDGWAHTHQLPDTFFTPWHAIIYSGVLGAALVLAGTALLAGRNGAPWREALPAGYPLSLLGVGLFLITGVADFVWHSLFGIEADLEALYSPPHLVLAAAGALIASGPLRAAWHQRQTSQATLWRAVLSLTLLLAILSFFTSESHPFDHPWAWVRLRPVALDARALGLPAMPAAGVGSQELAETLGISSILIQSGMLIGLLLLMVRRWDTRLPLGWLTFIFALNAAGMGIFHATPWVGPVALLAGIVADVLYCWLQPDVRRPQALRLWSALVPLVLYGLYFLALLLVGGIWWPIHLWAGGIALAGVTGWLMSYLILPPALPEGSRAGTIQHEA
jgi:hypothetical protein